MSSPKGSAPVSLPEAQVRRIAVEASADPRTVRRVLRGEGTDSMACDRVRLVLKRLGLTNNVNDRKVRQ